MKKLSLFVACLLLASAAHAQYSLPGLPFGYAAFEPAIDSMTMHIHHDVHHQAYVNNLNKVMAENAPELGTMKIQALMRNLNIVPENIRTSVRNNGGGHYNHCLFWTLMSPPNSTKPSGALEKAIIEEFGSIDAFKAAFETAATTRFGSGWAWLIVDGNKKLKVCSTPNQDNPIMPVAEIQGMPVIAIDVWEHAYYLKYQAKRADYVKNFWTILNWDQANKYYEVAMK